MRRLITVSRSSLVAGAAGRVGAELAVVSRRQRRRHGRRQAHRREVERAHRRERRLEDADRRRRGLEPDRLGQPRVRLDGGRQRSQAGHPHRPVRRRRAGRPTASKHTWRLIALDKATGKVVWDKVAYEGIPEDQAPPQVQPGLGDAGHRRQARDRLVRIGRALLLRLRRKAAVEEGPRRPQLRLVLRSRLRVGHRQLADHLQEHGDRAVRHPARLVPRRVRHRDRQGSLAHAARRDSVVVHADDPRGATARPSSSPRRRRSRAATIR